MYVCADNHSDNNRQSQQPLILSAEGRRAPVFSRLFIMWTCVCACVCVHKGDDSNGRGLQRRVAEGIRFPNSERTTPRP